jgi:hypothetical protein
MQTRTTVSLFAAGVVFATLAVTSPTVGLVDPGAGQSTALGDGTATVESVALDHDPVVTAGRFGTGVAYLRIPAVTVHLSEVTGRSRLVYGVTVPALDFERIGNRPIRPATSGPVSVGMGDRAFTYGTIDRDRYAASVEVSVQSFAVDRTVYDENLTIGVRTDG